MCAALIEAGGCADALLMEETRYSTPAAEQLADHLASEILDAARAEQRAPSAPSEYPRASAIAASVGTGAGVVALGYASWASGACIPILWVVDFGIHEFGHLLTYWLPWPVTASAGSLFQVGVPLGAAVWLLFRQRRWNTAALLVAWAGCSARNVAVYIADAPYRRLMLWGGEGTLHDWAELLAGRQMQYAEEIAAGVDAAGWIMLAAGLALALAPVIARSLAAHRYRTRAAADKAFEATLPVREPHGPIG